MEPDPVIDDIAGAMTDATAKLSPEQVAAVKERLDATAGGSVAVEVLTAAGGAVARMAAAQGKPTPSPEAAPSTIRAQLVATGALSPVLAEGTPIGDRKTLAELMADKLGGMPKDGIARGKVIVASARWQYPPERQLDSDATANQWKVDAVCHPQALVATGGICGPTNVDYDVPTWATSERPLRDGLPSFEISRGGIRFVQPPDLAEWEAATGIWTEATDAEPAGATKPVKALVCGEEKVVLAEAVPTRIGFGNMQSRFAPEQVAANTDLAMAAAARVAEGNLLKLIEETCVKNITTSQVVGATRDLITAINQAVAGYRNLHRIPMTQAITVILPAWCRQIIRVDLAREQAHQQGSDWNSLAVTDQMIEALLRVQGVNPIFHIDGQPEPTSKNYPSQFFAAPVEGEGIKHFPTKMTWYMFPEGVIQFLDGGRLDLGVVRDSTLDATNDYEMMVETFESIANRGFPHSAWQVVSTLCANGESAATVSTNGACA